MSLIAVSCQLTDFGFRRPSTSAPQVPKFSMDQLWKSLDTRSNRQRTTKANGMVLIKFSASAPAVLAAAYQLKASSTFGFWAC